MLLSRTVWPARQQFCCGGQGRTFRTRLATPQIFCKNDSARPTLDDVDRISRWGHPAQFCLPQNQSSNKKLLLHRSIVHASQDDSWLGKALDPSWPVRSCRGKSAKTRGTGSRNVPHRLNSDERKIYELAHKKVSSWDQPVPCA